VSAADQKLAAANVFIDNFSFTPKEITVAKGTTITWANHYDVPHTVVSSDQKFRSKALDTNDQFSFTFTSSLVDYWREENVFGRTVGV
jgi:plastocyanin